MRNRKNRTSWSLAVLMATASGCRIDDAGDDPGPCLYDWECSGGEVCRTGDCVPAPACELEGSSCSANGDCCDFDGSSNVGSGICVDDGQDQTCTSICHEGDDCSTGCCIALTDEDDYGACADESVCESRICAIGAAYFCACAEAVDPCTQDEFDGFLAVCEDPDEDLAVSLQCIALWGPDSIDECIDALDYCAPSAAAERHDLRDSSSSSEPLPDHGAATFVPESRPFFLRHGASDARPISESSTEADPVEHHRLVAEYFAWTGHSP